MDLQCIALKSLLGANSFWVSEINNAPTTKVPVGDGLEHIHKYQAFESLHPLPRITLRNVQWDYDFHNGNCKSGVMIGVHIEVVRPKPDVDDPAATEAQYDEVCESFRKIFQELSRMSYQSGSQLAQLVIEVQDGPHYEPSEERNPKAPSGNPLCVWWANLLVESKSN